MLLSGYNLWWIVVWDLDGFFMPPLVTSLCARDSVPGPLLDKTVLDLGALLENSIDNGLGSNGLSTLSDLIGCDQNVRLAILDVVMKQLGGETSKDNRVGGTNTSTRGESGNSMPGHGHVDGDGITLLDSHGLEDISHTADFVEKLSIGNFTAFIWLISFVDDCGLFRGIVDDCGLLRGIVHEFAIRY